MTNTNEQPVDWLQHIKLEFNNCYDLTIQSVANQQITLCYFDHLLEKAQYHQVITAFLDDAPAEDGRDRMMGIFNEVYGHNHADRLQHFTEAVLSGKIGAVYNNNLYSISAGNGQTRSIESSQKDTTVIGPHDAFVENAMINLSLVRRLLQTTSLKVQQFNIGKDQTIHTYFLYLEDQASPKVVEEARRRLSQLRIQQALDTSQIAKRLEDFPYSFFPQWLHSERPDDTCFQLMKGKIAVITAGSPTMIMAPTSFLEYFGVIGDVYERWQFGVFIRILRLLAVAISLLFSAVYVAVTTYHYQFIPQSLLTTIIQSRLKIPFEPMVEAFLMEAVIELLREASARLPNKIAQTIGIVGGLVLGQAVVEAGLASNVLIVAVAAGALASFIMPSYSMETSLRILKFFAILAAGFMGYYGILMFLALLITHICHLTSLKREYMMLNHFIAFFSEGRDKLWNSLLKKSGSGKQGGS